jgi:hypothetical protein
MQQTTTTITCDQCHGPAPVCPKGQHRIVPNSAGNGLPSFGVLVKFKDKPADLCPVCYNDVVMRSLTRKSDLYPLLYTQRRLGRLAQRTDRTCPECKGSGRVHVSACVAGTETAGMSDCRHCENGVCPVPCSHDHL